MIYEEGNYILPKTITLYLSGMGNFTIPSGVESQFNTKKYAYAEGGFFEDFQDRYYLCTSYPQISLFAERIQFDLAYTENPEIGVECAPNGMDELIWNTRCLGYAPSKILQQMQRDVLRRAGVDMNGFSSDNPSFPVIIRLLNSVQKYLAEVPSLEYGPIPQNVTGSQGQFVIETIPIISPTALTACEDIGVVTFVSKAPLSLPGPCSYLRGSFLYRIDKKETQGKAKFIFPYNITNPTVAQIATLDELNNGWSPLFDKKYHYDNVAFKTTLRIKKICSIDIKTS